MRRNIRYLLHVHPVALPSRWCASLQRLGIETVSVYRHSDTETNLLQVFREISSWIGRLVTAGKNVMVTATGCGQACVIAYRMCISTLRYLTLLIKQVMRKYQISWRQALYQVRHNFCGGIPLYETFVSQLRVWQRCSYDVYEIRHGRLRTKRPYREWIDRAVRREARAPVQRYCAQS